MTRMTEATATATTLDEGLVIECPCQGPHDEDCIVGFVMDREALGPGAGLVFDAEEARALRALRAGGLLPNGVRLEVAG